MDEMGEGDGTRRVSRAHEVEALTAWVAKQKA